MLVSSTRREQWFREMGLAGRVSRSVSLTILRCFFLWSVSNSYLEGVRID